MAKIELFDQDGNPIPLNVEKFEIEIKGDFSEFTKAMGDISLKAREVTLTLDDLKDAFDAFAKDLDDSLQDELLNRCSERCRCETWQCTGPFNHAETRFGPFHVFPQHPCADLADPMTALLNAEEELPGWEREPNAVEDLVRRWGSEDEPSDSQGSGAKGLTPKASRDIAIPISTLDDAPYDQLLAYKVRAGLSGITQRLPRVIRPPTV